jgi:O-antigen/teichoic acid export membrane protein
MTAMLSSIFWRYQSIGFQFFIIICLTRILSVQAVGQYLIIFGFISVTFTLSALGLPDGLVKELSSLRISGKFNSVLNLRKRIIYAALAINIFMCLPLAAIACEMAGLGLANVPIVALWWFSSACIFLFSQALIGTGKPTIATFFAYSLTNTIFLPVILVYSSMSSEWKLSEVINIATLSSLFSLIAVAAFSITKWSTLNVTGYNIVKDILDNNTSIKVVFLSGFPMMLSRLLQASLPWIPVWLLGVFHSVEAAAIYGIASRLSVAVSSVVAALRFSTRGLIVEYHLSGQNIALIKLNRTTSIIAAIPPIAGFIFIFAGGGNLIQRVFGASYLASVPILLVLFLGVLAEAFGGLSDEILKMSGKTYIVLLSLVVAALMQVIIGSVAAKFGPIVSAFITVLSFSTQYVWQVIWLSKNTPIKLIPYPAKANKAAI